jgi:hypothetical protein
MTNPNFRKVRAGWYTLSLESDLLKKTFAIDVSRDGSGRYTSWTVSYRDGFELLAGERWAEFASFSTASDAKAFAKMIANFVVNGGDLPDPNAIEVYSAAYRYEEVANGAAAYYAEKDQAA